MNLKDELIYYAKRIMKKKKIQSLRKRDDDISFAQFDLHKCIFIHIPKCAGISVAKSLLGKRIGHLSALDYRMIFSKRDFHNYFKFTFVRNPFARLVSAYEFMQNGGYGKEDENIVSVVKQYSSLEAFVMQYLTITRAKAIRHFRPQHYFICDSRDTILVDYLGRFELLEKDYEYIRKKIGAGEPLKKINITKGKDLALTDYYNSKQVVQKVISIYEKDFEILQYSKELSSLL